MREQKPYLPGNMKSALLRAVVWLALTLPAMTAAANEISPFIIGGDPVAEPELPSWMSAVLWSRDNGTTVFCGGTLVHPRWVMTAAHCVFGSGSSRYPVARAADMKVWFDITELDSGDQYEVGVTHLVMHPDYRDAETNYDSDIALLRLAESLPSRETMLPADIDHAATPDPDLTTYIMGFGATEQEGSSAGELMDAETELIPLDQCRDAWGPDVVSERMICAGFLDASDPLVDVCAGDSGGPLFGWYPGDPDTLWQFGIVSFGNNPCGGKEDGTRIPGVYTSVYRFQSWIDRWVNASGGAIQDVPPLDIAPARSMITIHACEKDFLDLEYNGHADRHVFDPLIRTTPPTNLRFTDPDRRTANRLRLGFTPPESLGEETVTVQLTAFDNFGNQTAVLVDLIPGKSRCDGLLSSSSNNGGGGSLSWSLLLLTGLGLVAALARQADRRVYREN